MNNKLNFILIATNAGGEGKTTIAKLLKCAYDIQNINSNSSSNIIVLDADQGNAAARDKDENALRVGWGVSSELASDIVNRTKDHHVIMDLGANALASAREIVDTLPAITELYKNEGRHCVAFLPVSTNKDAAIGAINILQKKLSDYDRYIVKVNRDSSDNFDGIIESEKTLELKYLNPGYQSLIKHRGGSISNAIMYPDKQYTMAATRLAEWVYDFISQEGMPDIFDNNILENVENCITGPIDQTSFSITNLSDCTNQALMKNINKSEIVKLLNAHGWNKEGLIEAAAKID